jgi:hypothetical protein
VGAGGAGGGGGGGGGAAGAAGAFPLDSPFFALLVAGDVVGFVPIAFVAGAAAPFEAATVLANGAEAFLGGCLAATAASALTEDRCSMKCQHQNERPLPLIWPRAAFQRCPPRQRRRRDATNFQRTIPWNLLQKRVSSCILLQPQKRRLRGVQPRDMPRTRFQVVFAEANSELMRHAEATQAPSGLGGPSWRREEAVGGRGVGVEGFGGGC